MNKILLAFILLFAIDTTFALDSATIKFVHAKTRTSFFNMCKQKVTGATNSVCSCLANKTVTNIDDGRLRDCSFNDDSCVTKVISDAGFEAFSQSSIKDCANRNS